MPDCEKPAVAVRLPRIACSVACRALDGHWFAHWSREPWSRWSLGTSPAASYAQLRSRSTWANRPIGVRHPRLWPLQASTLWRHVAPAPLRPLRRSRKVATAAARTWHAMPWVSPDSDCSTHAPAKRRLTRWKIFNSCAWRPDLDGCQPWIPSHRIAHELSWRLMNCVGIKILS